MDTTTPIETPRQRFAKNLALLRYTRGLTQMQLAELAHTSNSIISFYESGTRSPNLTNLLALADALQVTVDRLLVGKDNNVREKFINGITNHELEIIRRVLGK
jgi:transcriptional regulator with XRE-family HTH domain